LYSENILIQLPTKVQLAITNCLDFKTGQLQKEQLTIQNSL